MRKTNGFTLRVVPGDEDLARAAADIVCEVVRVNAEAVLALPTGSTPLGLFKELVRRVKAGQVDFSMARFFCLDEYLGLSRDDPNSLTGWLFREFFDPAGIDASQVHTVPSEAVDPDVAALAYEAELAAAGGLDLAVLGIGPNGHIAFNEPGSPPDSRTRVLALAPESQAQAAAYWEGTFPAPTRAMTMGVATLLDADRLLLIVTGASKQGVLREALTGPISPAVPASFLRTQSEKLTVVADEAAAGKL